MSAKHTPGPWTNHGRVTQPGLPHSAVVAKTLIARVYSEAYGDVEQETANARLIAAAPDLLLAAETVLAFIAGGSPVNADICNGLVYARLRDSVAKAKGTA